MVSKSHLALLDHTGQVPSALPYSSLQSMNFQGKWGLFNECPAQCLPWCLCIHTILAFNLVMHAEETGRFTRLRENDSVLEAASLACCAWGYSLAPEHKSTHLLMGSQQGIAGQALIAAGLLTQRQWGGTCPPQPCVSADYSPRELLCQTKPKESFLSFPWDGSSTRGCLICRSCSEMRRTSKC